MNWQPSQIWDVNNLNNNLYGCPPCPKCGNKFRWPSQETFLEAPNSMICDDCNYNEPYVDITLVNQIASLLKR